MKIKLYSFQFIVLFIVSILALTTQAFEDKKVEEKAKDKQQVQQPMPVDYGLQHQEDLKHYLPADQVKPLLAGSDELITLEKKYTTANSKGVAILLPDWQQGATNPKAINFLRQALPDSGWTTITIQPGDKPQGYPSTAITITEQQEQNTPLISEYKSKLAQLFTATMNKAQESPGIVIIIAQGNNGAFLIDLLSTDSAESSVQIIAPNALILLSSYRQGSRVLQPQLNEELAKKVSLLEAPILDLYLNYDHPVVIANMPLRASLSAQEMKVYYRQRQLLNTLSGYYPDTELLSQINGWLKSIGW